MHLAGNILSFIYVDKHNNQDEFTKSLNKPGFRGYNLIATRSVTKRELFPNGLPPIPPILLPYRIAREAYDRFAKEEYDGRFAIYPESLCFWSVFQRDEAAPASHGPFRFSLLYLCTEGVAAFQSLYVANSAIPKAVAIIQPGHACGRNWTDFTNPREIFARSVLGNPSGQPEFLLFGGYGKRDYYREPCWPLYREHICFVTKNQWNRDLRGSIGIWRKYPQDHYAGLALLRRDFERLLRLKDSLQNHSLQKIEVFMQIYEKSYIKLFHSVINQIDKYQVNELQLVSQQENVQPDDMDSSFIFYRDQIEPRIPAMRQSHKMRQYRFDW